MTGLPRNLPAPRVPADPSPVGYVGFGNMGWSLAKPVGQAYELHVFDRSAASMERSVGRGTKAHASAADVTVACRTVLPCRPTSARVRDVIVEPGGLARSAALGTLVIDQTIGDPAETRAMAAELATAEVELIDAPVSGGTEGCRGGHQRHHDRRHAGAIRSHRPGPAVHQPHLSHAGALGSGCVAKLANNLPFAATRLMTLEAILLAAKNGVDPGRMVEIMRAGSSRNFFLEHAMVLRIPSGKLASGLALGLLHKDVTPATWLGMASDTTMLFGSFVREVYRMFTNERGRDAQVNTVALMMDRLAGTAVVPAGHSLT